MKERKLIEKSIEKELKLVRRQEDALRRSAVKSDTPKWKLALTERVPAKVYQNLQKAFCKAFAVTFEKGTSLIEKTYNRETIRQDREIREYAFHVRSNRSSLKKIRKDAGASNLRNMALTSAEGIGLGALGIGLPDIVIFVGVLLKGIYEVALRYGYDYDTKEEQYLILKLMEASMTKGEAWEERNAEADHIIWQLHRRDAQMGGPGDVQNRSQKEAQGSDWCNDLEKQIERTAEVFAMDMVLLKFVQGLPVVGVIGGAGNPVYYNKVLKYVELKYRRRYLQRLRKQV